MHHFNDLSPVVRAILARFEGLPLKLSVDQAAVLLGEKPSTAKRQLNRKRGLFFKLAVKVDGRWHVPAARALAVAMGEAIPGVGDEKKRPGRPSNATRAARREGGAK